MSRREKPDHKTRKGRRWIPQSICNQKGCKFYGKPAAQGVCYSLNNHVTNAYVNQALTSGEEILKELKGLRKANKQQSDRAWIKALEGRVVCSWANETFMLDELVYLRAENARLRLQLGKWKGG